ncbi:Fic/DOC family protein [Legionella spiritensis]|uniref:Fic/DOC family protein n=1 Tax=Legionella spiritensis TaxID=452 RepID=UPI000F6BF8D2|nr:Fic family protein [Legionella spiritensis]VEG89802.1 Probable adenosine monophosphate-protein transferase fic [Legionella spiritensis]
MDEENRYSVPENEDFEPGSNDQVLKNLLGIKDRETIEHAEETELVRVGLELMELYSKDYLFTALDIQQIHELWLAEIYPFAGRYRTVSMSKAGFPFAAPNFIDKLMVDLENKYLMQYTPCNFIGEKLTEALGVVHVELIIIHPFREGNGRVARLLTNLMAMQADCPALNFSSIDKTETPDGFIKYIEAIHHGFNGDYEPIKEIFAKILEVS